MANPGENIQHRQSCKVDFSRSNSGSRSTQHDASTSRHKSRKQKFPKRNSPIPRTSTDEPLHKRRKTKVRGDQPTMLTHGIPAQLFHASSQPQPGTSSQGYAISTAPLPVTGGPPQLQLNKSVVYDLSGKSEKNPFVLSLCTPTTIQRFDEKEYLSPKEAISGHFSPHTSLIPSCSKDVNKPRVEMEKAKLSPNCKMIQELLNQPVLRSPNGTTSAVNNIISTTGNHHKTHHKYILMPVVQPSGNGLHARPQLSHVLINTNALPTPARSNVPNRNVIRPFPYIVNRHQLNPAINQTPRVQPCYPINCRQNRACCTAVICSTVDTISKWLNCNRDMLCKTLIHVADNLSVVVVTSILITKYKGKGAEYVALKWVGIALLLLTKYELKKVTDRRGSPIPDTLYYMDTKLKRFFDIYEGCLKLVKERRQNESLSAAIQNLRQEDNTFHDIINHIFSRYNETHPGVNIPTADSLTKLYEFMSNIEDAPTGHCSSSKAVDRGIISVLQSEASVPICQRHVRDYTTNGAEVWQFHNYIPKTATQSINNTILPRK